MIYDPALLERGRCDILPVSHPDPFALHSYWLIVTVIGQRFGQLHIDGSVRYQ